MNIFHLYTLVVLYYTVFIILKKMGGVNVNTKHLGLVAALVVLMASLASAQLGSAQTTICNILQQVYTLLLYIASGVGAVMIVLMGVLWVSSADSAKSRNSAKNGVVHAIIGLIIVSLAIALVTMVLPEGSDCITTW
ncbi:MAG: TrbC/VirB2 family protein [Candidatus Altiarchaeota archaeon]